MLDVLLHTHSGEGGVERRKHVLGQAGDGAHPAYGVVPGGPGRLERAGEVTEDVVRLPGELGTGRSRPGTSGVAVEEPEPGPALEPGEPLARRGLGDLESAGRGAHGAGAGDGQDQLQILGRDNVGHWVIL